MQIARRAGRLDLIDVLAHPDGERFREVRAVADAITGLNTCVQVPVLHDRATQFTTTAGRKFSVPHSFATRYTRGRRVWLPRGTASGSGE